MDFSYHVTDNYRFNISFIALDWVPNLEKTRWFLVLRIGRPDGNGLNKLLHVSNQIVKEYGQPQLYVSSALAAPADEMAPKKSARSSRHTGRAARSTNMIWSSIQDVSDAFHISIAWTLESPSEQLLKVTKSLNTNIVANLGQILVRIEEVKAKIGNVVTSIPLPTAATERQGLFDF